MNAYKFGKEVVKLVSTMGISTIVATLAKKGLPANASKFTKVCVVLSSVAVTSLVSRKVEEHIDEEIDNTVRAINDVVNTMKH